MDIKYGRAVTITILLGSGSTISIDWVEAVSRKSGGKYDGRACCFYKKRRGHELQAKVQEHARFSGG